MHDSFFSGASTGASSNPSGSAGGGPFGFGNFVPGFDFLQALVQSAGQQAKPTGAMPAGMPDWSKWVAPTLEPEEIEKRIGELKTVQFWLEQNARALTATIQALEVQKMTLATLRGMNVQMNDVAGRFGFGSAGTAGSASAAPAPEPAAAPAWHDPFAARTPASATASGPAEPPSAGPYDDMITRRSDPAPAPESASEPEPTSGAAADAPGAQPGAEGAPAQEAVAQEAMQWWNALTGQFQQIAASALADAARQAQSARGVQMTESAMRAFDAAGRMAGSVMAGTKIAAKKGAEGAGGKSAGASKGSRNAKPRAASAKRAPAKAPAAAAPEVVWKAPSGARRAGGVAAKAAAVKQAGQAAGKAQGTTSGKSKTTAKTSSRAPAKAARPARKR